MRILFVAATSFEVESLKLKVFSIDGETSSPITTHHSLLVTGVGMVATALSLGKELAANRYDLAINLGIAGSFDKTIVLGELVEITEDTLSELGVEDDLEFLSIAQLGFGESVFKSIAKLSQFDNQFNIKQVNAITVNTVHGNEASIAKIRQRLNPQIESMEGAAFFYACKEFDLPCIQIRAVSNYLEKRNRDNWQIELAVKNLNTFAVELLNRL